MVLSSIWNSKEASEKQLAEGTHFDFMGFGFVEKTGWVSEKDSLLVHDLNKNGIIDDGRELFGDMTQMSNGKYIVEILKNRLYDVMVTGN